MTASLKHAEIKAKLLSKSPKKIVEPTANH